MPIIASVTKKQLPFSRCLCITLPETNIAPENGWLEDDRFLSGWLPGRCELLGSGSVDLHF